jgi:HK97 family phage portal protein
MSILRAITAPERRAADPRLDWGNSRIPTNGEIGMTAAGVRVNQDDALAIPTVYTCVAIIADAISSLPVQTLVRTKDRSKVPVDPAPALIDNPWPDSTRQDWLAQVMFSLLMRGNAYGFIASRDKNGYPSAVQILDPDTVTARRANGEREYRVNGHIVPTENIMHIPALVPPGGFVGLDPIRYMANSFGLATAATRYGASFFQNSALPSGVLETNEDLSERETLELARAWRAAHQGVGQSQMPAVLTGGVQWKQISLSPDNAQFLGSRQFSASEICAWFRVPEHLALGNADRTTSWGIGVESMELQFVTYTLGPWMNKLETQLSAYLPTDWTVQFDLTDRVRAPSLERYQRYTLARNAGLLSINEIRAMENMAPLPGDGGDDYWAPLNFAPVDSPVFQDPTISSGGIGGGMENSPAKATSDAENN